MSPRKIVKSIPDAQIDAIDPRKPAQRILEHEISEGLAEMERSTQGLFFAALSAGLDIGFSFLLMATVYTRMSGEIPTSLVDIFVAIAYTLGFIFVVLGRSELFTEHTTLAALPVLNRRKSLGALGRLWGTVYVANLLGTAIFAALFVNIGPALGIVEMKVFGEIARKVVEHDWWVILLSGTLAGWMMGLLSWLVAAGRDTISQIVVIFLVTAAIGYAHLHHSIVGSAEVLGGIFAGQGITWGHYFYFLLWATLGNSIGGVVFVALIKYGHIVYGNEELTHKDLNAKN